MKACTRCGVSLPLDAFYRRADTGGRYSACKGCLARMSHAPAPCDRCGMAFVPQTGRQRFCSASCRQPTMAEGVCQCCGDAFPARRRADKWCSRECRNHIKRSRKFGLTDQVARDLWRQDSCDACGRPRAGRMSIDHCHETGRVRGFVHQSCNLAIAQAGHDIETLHAWAVYLERGAFDLRDLCVS